MSGSSSNSSSERTNQGAGGRQAEEESLIATKLEAFHGRGRGDIVASHDVVDIIAVVDGRPEIVSEVAAASTDVRRYIASELRALLDNRDFTEGLGGFLLPDAASQGRRSLLEGRLRSLTRP